MKINIGTKLSIGTQLQEIYPLGMYFTKVVYTISKLSLVVCVFGSVYHISLYKFTL